MRERVRDAFNQITADEKLKEQTKMFLAQKRRQAPARRPVRRMAAILVCLMCLVLGVGGWAYLPPPLRPAALNRLRHSNSASTALTASSPCAVPTRQAVRWRSRCKSITCLFKCPASCVGRTDRRGRGVHWRCRQGFRPVRDHAASCAGLHRRAKAGAVLYDRCRHAGRGQREQSAARQIPHAADLAGA